MKYLVNLKNHEYSSAVSDIYVDLADKACRFVSKIELKLNSYKTTSLLSDERENTSEISSRDGQTPSTSNDLQLTLYNNDASSASVPPNLQQHNYTEIK